MKMGPVIAEVGKIFSTGDTWRCGCGAEHEFGAYAAAHWGDELVHKCENCKTSRTFLSGEVILLE